MANSSKISLNTDCESFVPPQDVEELLALGDESITGPLTDDPLERRLISSNEDEKKKTIERLYRYYNFLLLEQNRD